MIFFSESVRPLVYHPSGLAWNAPINYAHCGRPASPAGPLLEKTIQ